MTQDNKPKTGAEAAMWLAETIREFCLTSLENSMHNGKDEWALDEPLVGFSNGNDPLYEFLKNDIGTPFMMPVEIFERSFPGRKVRAEELTVISWILPKTRLTKNDNRKETTLPSERWARAKHYGGAFLKQLMAHVTGTLDKAGVLSIAPSLAPFWTVGVSERYGLASN